MNGNLLLGKASPKWKGKAVVEGEIVELSSDDFNG
jgi:hypothetical protein